jgi:hypothetical protein
MGIDWCDAEVIARWRWLFSGSELSRRYSRVESVDPAVHFN